MAKKCKVYENIQIFSENSAYVVVIDIFLIFSPVGRRRFLKSRERKSVISRKIHLKSRQNGQTYPPPYMCSVEEGCGGSKTEESGLEPEPCC